MARVFEGERTFLHPVLRPLERLCYAVGGVREDAEQRWTQYAGSLLVVQRLQLPARLPVPAAARDSSAESQGFGTGSAPANATAMTPDLAFNTAVSFMTNTNWQCYGGETTLSYLVQMAALTVQNFVSAAAGIAVAIALIRGFARQQANAIGNFWVDLTRAAVYVLLPLSLVGALFLVLAGRHPELRAPYTAGHHGRRRDADDRAGAGRLAGSDQDAGHQRRRLLQRQLGPSLREPDAAHQPRSDAADLRRSRPA